MTPLAEALGTFPVWATPGLFNPSIREHQMALKTTLKTHTRAPDPPPPPVRVQLQLNNSGAWKTIARFDAGCEQSADNARAAGQLLGELNPNTTLRIATDEPMPAVLVRWDAERGWWPVLADRQ